MVGSDQRRKWLHYVKDPDHILDTKIPKIHTDTNRYDMVYQFNIYYCVGHTGPSLVHPDLGSVNRG